MFTVYDKNKKELSIKDEVSYGSEESCLVIGFNSTELVMIQGKTGAPKEVLGSSLVLKYSLVQDILSLRDDVELQKILNEAEERYRTEVTKSGGKKGKASSKATVATGTLDLGI